MQLVRPNGQPYDNEQQIVEDFGKAAHAATRRFRGIKSPRSCLAITCGDEQAIPYLMRIIQRAQWIYEALQVMEEKAVELKARAKDMHDCEIGSAAGGYADAASILRNAIFGGSGEGAVEDG